MKIAVCQMPDGLMPGHPAWRHFARSIESERPAFALLNEMPFGPWLPSEETFKDELAAASLAAHETALQAIRKLPTAVIGSRPIRGGRQGQRKLVNEAFLFADGVYQAVHHKQYFPQEAGFFEDTWFSAVQSGFDVTEYRGVRIGVLLCTELMFTEWARHYRRQGAHIIVAPRASGASTRHWHASARMAAIVSGCYVLSSNRVSPADGPAPHFGGKGLIYSPDGSLLGVTSTARPFLCATIDLERVADAQRGYPCYVREIDMPIVPKSRGNRGAAAPPPSEDTF